MRVELFETLILFIVYQLMQFGLKLIVVSLFNQSGIETFQSGAISIDIQYLEKMFQRELQCLRCSFFVIVFALFLVNVTKTNWQLQEQKITKVSTHTHVIRFLSR